MKKIIFLLIITLIFTAGCMKKAEVEEAAMPAAEGMIVSTETPLVEEMTPLQTEEKQIQPAATQAATVEGVFKKPSIEEMQTALQNANLYQGKIDGKLGPMTKKAIEEFQTQNNLKADGKVGPQTWQKLQPYLTKPQEKSATTTKR